MSVVTYKPPSTITNLGNSQIGRRDEDFGIYVCKKAYMIS